MNHASTPASQTGPEGHEAGYDAQRKKRFKTVELLVAERDWEPPRPPFAGDQTVALRVAFAEVAVRERVKQAGGKWNPDRKVWELRYDQALTLGLASRIVPEPASTGRCQEQTAEYLHADAWSGIQLEMPASTAGCQHLVVDAGVAAEFLPTTEEEAKELTVEAIPAGDSINVRAGLGMGVGDLILKHAQRLGAGPAAAPGRTKPPSR